MSIFEWRYKHYNMFIGWILSVLMLAGVLNIFVKQQFNGNSSNIINHAAVIKTQKAADSIKGGIKGIDVSKWQGNINWSKVAGDGVEFAFIRASYGQGVDDTFVNNAKNADANGIKVGAYHYATFKNKTEMKKEADVFIAQLKKVNITYPVVLDLEASKGLSKSQLTSLATEFMEYVESKGYTVMFYSYQNFFGKYVDINKISEYPLWVANYIQEPGSLSPKVWQYSSQGSVKGISGNVDINIAYSDLSVKKIVTVDKAISNNIKTFLNHSYGAEINIDEFNYKHIQDEMHKALQVEIGTFLEKEVDANGVLSKDNIQKLAGITNSNTFNSNIACIVQSKLFYNGYYLNDITGAMDEHTIQAVKDFQKDKKLEQTGILDEKTWLKLFPPTE